MKPTLLSSIVFLALITIFSNTSNANTYYWISTSGSANNNWSTLGNWALSSCGGATPTSLPGTGDSVVFSGGCTNVTNCTIDVSINVLSFRIDNAYTGSISQSSGNAITIAYGKFANGTFTGSSAAITFSTSLTIEGGSFTTTSGTTTIKGNFSYTGGTFYPNGGRIVFYKTLTVSGVNSSSYINLYDVEFQAIAGNSTITLSDIILNVADSTLLTGSDQLFINASQSTSVINASGDVKIYNSSGTGGGTAIIVVNGSTNQHVTGNATTEDVGKLPNLTINSSGTVYLIGDITMGGSTSLTYTAGTINAGASKIIFYYDNTINGAMIFGNVEFQGTYSTCIVSNTITVNGNLYTTSTGLILINTGTINLYGNFAISNTSVNTGGSVTVNLSGTSNDSIIAYSGVASGEGYLPKITINKTGGTLYFSGQISLGGNWTNNYSTANINPGTADFYIFSPYSYNTIGGTYPTPVWNAQFIGNDYASYIIGEDSALIVKNNLTLTGSESFTLSGYSINVYGNIIASNTDGGASGSTVLNLVGSETDSIISPSGYIGGECFLPTININKTGGTLYLIGTISLGGNWTNNYSQTNINSGTSTLYFEAYSTTNAIGGTYRTSVWNAQFVGGDYSSYSISEDSTLIVKNNLTLSGSEYFSLSNNSINIYGNIIASNTDDGVSGSTVLNLVGSANDSIISPSGYTLGECYLPAIYINKTGNTLSLIGNISEGNNWTYVNGTVNAGTSTVGMYGAYYTLTTSSTYGYMAFNNLTISAYTIMGSALNISKNLTINSSATLGTSSSNYQINIGGNWINNGTYNSNSSNVTFNGSGSNYVEGSTNTSFYSLTLNKTGTLTLSDPVTVTNALILTSGDILTSSTNLLALNNGSSVSSANDNSFVNGPVKKIGNSAFTFPTGGDNSYHPIKITAPSSTSDAFTAQYSYLAPAGRTSTDDSLTFVSSCDYWLLSHPTGSSNVTVSLGWGTNSCNIVRLSSLRVGYFNTSGSKWTNLGQSATTGSTASGSITATTASSISSTADTFAISKHSPTPTISAGSNVTICSGASTNLSATVTGGLSPYTYSWNPANGLSNSIVYNPTASPTTTTTYTVTVNDDDNAPTAIGTVVVTVNPLPTVTASASSSTICYNSSSTLTAGGALTYSWSPATGLSVTTGSSVTATLTATTTYTVTGTDVNGCVNTATQTITVNPLPTVTISASPSTICYNSSSTLTASGAVNYAWAPATSLSATTGSSVTTTLTASTTYTVTGTNANGCVNSATEIITVNPLPTITVSASPSLICYNSSSTLTAGGAATYTWAPTTGLSNTIGSSDTANLTATTTYTVTGTDVNGCVNTALTSIAVNPQLIANAGYTRMGSTSNDSLGGSPAASGGALPYSFSWETNNDSVIASQSNPVVSPSQTTMYYLTVTDSLGCIAQDTATIFFLPEYSSADTTSILTMQYADPMQFMSLSDTSYNTIVKIDDAYFKYHPDTSEDGLQANYSQWKYFWSARLHPNSNGNPSFNYAEKQMYNYYNNESCESSGSSGDWTCIGPFLQHTANIGRVTAIWVDPANENHILIGSPTGSIWRTTNGRDLNPTWVCITDGSGLPSLGISNIAVDPENSNIIYIATGLTTGVGNQYSLGVCYTTNGNAAADLVVWHIDQNFYQYVLNLTSSTPSINQVSTEIKFQPGTQNVFATVTGVNASGANVTGLIWRKDSVNSNNTWVPLTLPLPNPSSTFLPQYWNLNDIEFDPSDSDIVFVTGIDVNCLGGGIPVWESKNGGTSWKTVYIPTINNTLPSDSQNLTNNDTLTLGSPFPNPVDNTFYTNVWYNQTGNNWKLGKKDGTYYTADVVPNQNPAYLVSQMSWVATQGQHDALEFDAYIPAGTELIVYLTYTLPYASGNFNIPICTLGNTNSTSDIIPTEYNEPVYFPSSEGQWCQGLVFEVIANTSNSHYSSSDSLWFGHVGFYPESLCYARISFATTHNTDHVDILSNAFYSYIYSLDEINVPTGQIIASQEYDLSQDSHTSAGNNWPQPGSFDGTFSVMPDDNIPTDTFFFGIWDFLNSTNGMLSSLSDNCDFFSERNQGSDVAHSSHVDIRRIYRYYESDSLKYIYYLGTDGGILRYDPSIDPTNICYGANYNCLNGNGLALNQFIGLSTCGLLRNYVAGGTIDNAMFSYNGTSWIEGAGGDCYNNATSPILYPNDSEQTYAYSNGYGGWYSSNDGGVIWQFPSFAPYDYELPGLSTNVVMHFHPVTGKFYTATDKVYELDEPDSGWDDISNHYGGANLPTLQIAEFNVNYSDTNITYVAYNDTNRIDTGKVLFQINGDESPHTINAITIPPGIISNFQYITDVISDPIQPNRFWVSFNGFYGSSPIKHKVLYGNYNASANTISWTDISTGLPDFPINKLVYQVGSNDIIYAATDVGVYYWNKTANNDSGSWYCYSENLPPAIYNDIDINYCVGNVVASSYGRGMWESPMIPTHTFATNPIPVSTSTNWTTSRQVYSDVKVLTGTTLTISGSHTVINMEGDAEIIVDTGAKLIVDSATLTNGCGNMWGGIQVIGNPNEDQLSTPNHQGMVVIENGAAIENAYAGILTDAASYLSPDYSYPNGIGTEGGGIVQVTDSKFINNRGAIKFDPYHSPKYTGTNVERANLSYIKNSSFICNAYLNAPYDSQGIAGFISMWDVHGIQIQSNTFTGFSGILNVTLRGIGINSADADYTVDGICKTDEYPCNNYTQNNFSYLYYGIQSIVGTPENIVYPTKISNSTFSHTDRCIYLSGYQNNPSVSNDSMTLNENSDTTYGLYLSACNGFAVLEDTIKGISQANSYGMIIRNSNTNDAYSSLNPSASNNVINNNSFAYLNYASVGFGDNAFGIEGPRGHVGLYGIYGLEFLCNQYFTNQYAIAGFPDNVEQYGFLMKNSQGSSSNPANNTFDDDATWNLYCNYGPPIDYYYSSTGSSYNPGTLTSGFNLAPTNSTNSCVISSGSGGISSQIGSTKTIIAAFNTTEGTLYSKIDGGNQSALLGAIANTLAIPSPSLRTTLLAAGPYLSDTVLDAMIDRSVPMADSDVVAVALNNSPLDSAVYRNLFNTFFAGELPAPVAELRSNVEAAQSGVSPRDTLYDDIAEDASQQSYALQNIGNLYTIGLDSGIMTIDSIINLYIEYNMPTQALNYILYKGDTASARALIDTLPTSDSVESSFKNYYLLQLAIKENDSTAYALSSAQLTKVNSIASQQTYSGFMALNLLSTLNGQHYHEQFPIVIGEGGSMVDRMPVKNQSNNTIQNVGISIAPNPAKDEVTLSFGGLAGEQGLLTIYNELGNVVYEQNYTSINSTLEINTSSWTQGIYEIRLIMSGGNTYKSKLAIVNR